MAVAAPPHNYAPVCTEELFEDDEDEAEFVTVKLNGTSTATVYREIPTIDPSQPGLFQYFLFLSF